MKQIILFVLLMAIPFAAADIDRNATPRLVYTEFEQIVVTPGSEQALKLDATNFWGGVTSAHAVIADSNGEEQQVMLRLVSGDENYGTWRGTFPVGEVGRHDLTTIFLGDGYEEEHEFIIEERSYWVSADTQRTYHDLIYTAMDKIIADIGEEITITLDARDGLGLENVSVVVTWWNGSKEIPMEHVRGDMFYGTYQGKFTPEVGGGTYNLTSVNITNLQSSEVIEVTGRSVYVAPPPYVPPVVNETEEIPVTVEEWEDQLTKPMLPTQIGFALMIVLLVFLLISHKLIVMVMRWK